MPKNLYRIRKNSGLNVQNVLYLSFICFILHTFCIILDGNLSIKIKFSAISVTTL